MAKSMAPPPDALVPRTQRGEGLADEGLEPLEPNTLVIENAVLREGFTVIPNYILKDPTLSPGAKTTFMLLLSYAWQEGSCFPGQERLSRELGVGKRSIIRWLKELEEHQVIASKRRGLGKTNLYTILDRKPPPPATSGTSGSAKLAHLEMTESTIQEVPKSAHKENTEYKDTEQQRGVVAAQGKKKRSDTSGKSNNSSGEHPAHIAVQVLIQQGISPTVAKRLASRYRAERIFEKLDYLAYLQEIAPKKVSNPRGWLRRAIEDDFGPPDGYKPPEVRAAEAAEREREAEERRAWLESQETRPAPRSWSEQLAAEQGLAEELLLLTRELQNVLSQQMTRATFSTWASRILITQVEEDQVHIAVPSQQAYEWLAHRLKPKFESALAGLLGEAVSVQFAVMGTEQDRE